MAAVALLTLLGVAFYAFIGLSSKEAVQLFLVAAWGLMLLSALISPFF